MYAREMCQVPFFSHHFPIAEEALFCFCAPTTTLVNESSALTASGGVDTAGSASQKPQAGAGEKIL